MAAMQRQAVAPGRRIGPDPEADDGVRRYFDARYGATIVKVLPGDHYVTGRSDEMLVTVLGSCVSACIRDTLLGVGGMNHFMLPASDDGSWGKVSAEMRYGNFAMETLINDILKRGGRRDRLEIKVFGGANLGTGAASVGDQNASFVERYLESEGLPIAAGHLRGIHPRRIHYSPATGVVMMLELKSQGDLALLGSEARYRASLRTEQVDGGVELFS